MYHLKFSENTINEVKDSLTEIRSILQSTDKEYITFDSAVSKLNSAFADSRFTLITADDPWKDAIAIYLTVGDHFQLCVGYLVLYQIAEESIIAGFVLPDIYLNCLDSSKSVFSKKTYIWVRIIKHEYNLSSDSIYWPVYMDHLDRFIKESDMTDIQSWVHLNDENRQDFLTKLKQAYDKTSGCECISVDPRSLLRITRQFEEFHNCYEEIDL
jgi:hypothetical protein